ncbi:methyl-accepting chemotaxis protein [Bdellovibrionota bacterium FG-1]
MSFTDKFSLKHKLVTICTLISLFGLASGVASFLTLRNVSGKYEHVTHENLNSIIANADMRLNFRRIHASLAMMGLSGMTPEGIHEYSKNIRTYVESYEAANKAFNALPLDKDAEVLYNKTNALWLKFKDFSEKGSELMKSSNPADHEEFRKNLNGLHASIAEYTVEMGRLADYQADEAKTWVSLAQSASTSANLIISVIVALGFVASQIFSFFFSSSLAGKLAQIADRLSEGAQQVASESTNVSSASTELSSAAHEQAAALQETVASLDQVSAMVNKNSDNATRSQEVSSNSQSVAEKGKVVVTEMISSIDAISKSNAEIMRQIEQSNQEMGEIVKVISEIGSKTKVINDIVFQTKLLSFNASVEAARAGEHGKGFAVVAEEVGNLAQMSGNAAKEITQMLDASISKVESIVTQTQSRVDQLVVTGREKVEAGTLTARRCGEVLDEIVTQVNTVTQMTAEIATASQEQSQGVQEITKAMGQLDQVTQQNTAASQEASGASERLSKQAHGLRAMVGDLRHEIDGNGDTSSGSVAKAPSANAAKPKSSGSKKLAKVIPIKPNKPMESAAEPEVRQAVGASGLPIPKENDPRFQDV